MPADPIKIARKELSSEEVLDRIEDGQRVIVTVGTLGVEKDVVLRKTERGYVCDTGFKLLTYDDREGLQQCIERLQLTEPEE